MTARVAHRVGVGSILIASAVTALSSPSSADPRHAQVAARHQVCGVEVHVDPESRTIAAKNAAKPVRFTARVGVRKGWRGVVDLSIKGLPSLGTGSLAPRSLTFSGAEHTGKADVAVSIGANPQHHRYQLWVAARCGKEAALDGFRVEIARDGHASGIHLDPAEVTVQPGDSAHYCITGATTPRELDVRGLPKRTSSSFSRDGHGDACIWLKIRTHRDTPVGAYTFTVANQRRHGSRARATALLRVISGAEPFTISGDLAEPLELGVPQALDLTFGNPNPFPLQLKNVDVAVAQVDEAHRDACPVQLNFRVTPFSGPYDIVIIPAHGTTSLSALGIPTAAWPQLEWLNTDVEQSGCLGVELSLAYTGTAVGDPD